MCKCADVRMCECRLPLYSNPNALFVEPEDKVTIRTKDAVADRALALCYIGLKSEGLEQTRLDKMDQDLGISAKLSPNEKAYATATRPTEQQKTDANWRYEGLHVMLWALGFIDTLSYPDQMCNVADDVKIIHGLGGKQFREKAKLRSKKEILDQADLILRLDWACVSARVKNKTAPGGLDSGVVLERHHALNWLINYLQQQANQVNIQATTGAAWIQFAGGNNAEALKLMNLAADMEDKTEKHPVKLSRQENYWVICCCK